MRMEKTRNLVLCALFAALIAAGAFIRIPIPVVPFTLQVEFVLLAGLLLGGKWGCAAVLVYIFMGLLGLPVFTEGGGLAYVLKPSFGYIIGFAVAAYVTGTMANKTPQPGYRRLLASIFTGLGIIYLFGVVYFFLISNFYLGTPMGMWPVILQCFLMVVPGDIVLCFLAAALTKRLIPVMRRGRR